MMIFSILAFSSIFLFGAVMFIECKIIEDLPESNNFKKWWRAHLIGEDPEKL